MPTTSALDVGLPGVLPVEETSYIAAAGNPNEDEQDAVLLGKLKAWLQHERDRQAENRMQMAIDHDFYDGLQWSEEDARAVQDRGQAPLVFNEVAVTLNWIIGTEKRERTDWRVLPREAGDEEMAQVKTKVMKYVSDVNRVPYMRSACFAEAAIGGLSWLEDSINADPTADILYSGWETWRNCLHDSYHKLPDGSDMRYFFRWRHVDLDIAKLMFPDQKEAIERAAIDAQQLFVQEQDDLWYLGERLNTVGPGATANRRTVISQTVTDMFSRRTRVKIYECWYRDPVQKQLVRGGPYHGEVFDQNHQGQAKSINEGWASVAQQPMLQMKLCYFTERDILAKHDSPFSHNDFPFTPIYAFRRGRDGMPYGYVRQARDPQEDLNKRMSKSLFILSVNQLITEEGAFNTEGEYTLQDAIDNASNPQGVFVLKDGAKRFEIRRDYMEEQQQVAHVSMDRGFIQSGTGVTDELLGRRTNAVSGTAIQARQDQGSATTAAIFDNRRLASQVSGQKQLSNTERFYSGPKVIRLTEKKGALDWVKVNQPEVQPDGSVRFLNDLTATRADFIVDEQDYRATLRQAAYESLQDMLGKIMAINPQWAIELYPLVVNVADFPGKEEIIDKLKELAAPKPPSDEELHAKAEQEELAKQAAASKIAKEQADANLSDAKADQIRVTLQPGMTALDLPTVQAGQAQAGQGALPAGATPAQQAAPAQQPAQPDALTVMAQTVTQLANIVGAIAQRPTQGA